MFQHYSDKFRHIQAYLDPYVTVTYPNADLFKILKYSKACHMKNLTQIRNN